MLSYFPSMIKKLMPPEGSVGLASFRYMRRALGFPLIASFHRRRIQNSRLVIVRVPPFSSTLMRLFSSRATNSVNGASFLGRPLPNRAGEGALVFVGLFYVATILVFGLGSHPRCPPP